jgi:hypothetical protein
MQLMLIGVNGNKDTLLSQKQYDNIITGAPVQEYISQRQKVRQTKSKTVQQATRSDKNSAPGAIALPLPVVQELLRTNNKTSSSFLNKTHGFGMKSKTAGGRVRVIKPIGGKYGQFVKRSDWTETQVAQEVPNAFKTEHNIFTICHAIDALDEKLQNSGMSTDAAKEIRGAVASKFYEDISFRMSDVHTCEEFTFKHLKLDIDQVTTLTRIYSIILVSYLLLYLLNRLLSL